MKYFLPLFLLLFSQFIFGQYYDNFKDGNYTENPKWFVTDLNAVIIRNNGAYVAELTKSSDNDGTFKTTNYLAADTEWGCTLNFDNNSANIGIIDFVLSAQSIYTLTAVGYFIRINTSNNTISFYCRITSDSEILLAQSGAVLPNGNCHLTLKIDNNSDKWNITASIDKSIIWQKTVNHQSNISSVMSGINLRDFNQGYNCIIEEIYCGQSSAPESDILPNSIIFSEIVHKPTNNAPLPNAEWVEIYNTTESSIDLGGCQLLSSSKSGIIESYILNPKEYVILCSNSAAEKMQNITSHIATVSNMPSLLNDGDMLIINDKNNIQICYVEYSNDWYSGEPENAGGWSLERRDVKSNINDGRNWGTSCSINQGTPGEVNCLQGLVSDTIIPCITGVNVKDSRVLELFFNKEMNTQNCTIDNIALSGPGDEIASCSWISPKNTTLEITLKGELDDNRETTIEITDFICANDIPMNDTIIRVGLPHNPNYMDIVINEIMPYVSEGQSKFIELYNNTPHFISTNNLKLCNLKGEEISNYKSLPANLIIPYGYALISNNLEEINCILGINESCVYLKTTLPSFAGKSGNIAITDDKGNIIDALSYSEKWHHGIINDNHNVSLERISTMGNTNDSLNWHSASSLYNYQSGGWQNSHHRENNAVEETSDKYFWLDSKTFTPNNDGVNDLMILKYSLTETGYIATITLYTRDGYEVGVLAENILLNQTGEWLWQGNNPSGGLIEAGIYILNINAYNLNGKKINTKIIFVKG